MSRGFESPVCWEVEAGVGRLVLHRPAKHNALDLSGIACLAGALEELGGRPDLRVVTVSGSGCKSFCAGLEFADIRRIDWRNNPFTAACDALENLPVPTVCSVRGGAYGAGVDLALACDFRIGTPESRLRVPALALGVHYDRTGLERAVRRLGLQGAKRIFLSADRLDAKTLLRIGFLDEIVPDAEIDAYLESMAATLAGLAPVAVAGVKRSLQEIAAGCGDTEKISKRVAKSWLSEDFREGVLARDEERKPSFSGR